MTNAMTRAWVVLFATVLAVSGSAAAGEALWPPLDGMAEIGAAQAGGLSGTSEDGRSAEPPYGDVVRGTEYGDGSVIVEQPGPAADVEKKPASMRRDAGEMPEHMVVEQVFDDALILETGRGSIVVPIGLLPEAMRGEGAVIEVRLASDEREKRLAEGHARIERMRQASVIDL